MSDSDWAVRHSTSGWVFMYNSAAISWGSKKQATIALSSCEAEIMAASEAAKECVYLARFADELGFPLRDGPPEMDVDNQSAIAVAYNPEHHPKVKHMERRHLFIQELVENLQIRVPFVKSNENLAARSRCPQRPSSASATRS